MNYQDKTLISTAREVKVHLFFSKTASYAKGKNELPSMEDGRNINGINAQLLSKMINTITYLVMK